MADAALDFLAAARAFRAVLEQDDVEERQFARHVRNAVARVYLAAALMGPPTAAETDELPASTRDRRDSDALRERLRTRFGDADGFVEIFDAAGVDGIKQRPLRSSLSGELVEIDEDLADAIAWLETGATDALWQVRFDFEQHWGRHAVDVLRPLHQLATYGVV